MIKFQCLAFFSVYIRQCEFWMCTIVASPSFLPEENCNVFCSPSHQSPAWHTWHWQPPRALQSRAEPPAVTSERRQQDAEELRWGWRHGGPAGVRGGGLLHPSRGHIRHPRQPRLHLCAQRQQARDEGYIQVDTIQRWFYLYWYYIWVFWITTIS